jgi:Fe-S oxidoreductase
VERKDVTKKQIEEFAQEYAQTRSNRGDEKYIKIEKANLSWIEYSFDIDAWIADNFRGQIPKYKPPISLRFRYRRDWPRFIYVNAPFHDFQDFIVKKFRDDFLKKNKRKLKHRKFSFLNKITADLFQYRIDFQAQYIIASLKYSVILGSLAAYMAFFHNKEIDSKQEKDVKKKIKRYDSIKKLDRYIKRL